MAEFDLQLSADHDDVDEQDVLEQEPDEVDEGDDRYESEVDGVDQQPPEAQGHAVERQSAIRAMRKKLKEQQKARKEMEAALDRLARLAGLDRQTLIQRLDELERMQQMPQPQTFPPTQTTFASTTYPVQQPYAAGATDPYTTPVSGDTAVWAATNAYQLAKQALLEQEIQMLKNDPFFADIDSPEKKMLVLRTAQQTGMGVKQAYLVLYGEERAKQLAQEAERKALEQARKRGSLTAETDAGMAPIEKLGLTEEEYRIAQQLGLDPRVYAKLKSAQGYDDYRKAMKQRG